jgi:hypothetical protein
LDLRQLFVSFGGELFLVWGSQLAFAKLDNDLGSVGVLISSHERADSPQAYGNAEFAEFKSRRHSRQDFAASAPPQSGAKAN